MKRILFCLVLILWTQAIFSQSITHYRYWFDDNFAGRTLVAVSGGTSFTLNQSINASAVSIGSHIVTFQFRDNNGKWSVPIATSFVKTKPFSSKIVGYRYWINDNFTAQVYKSLTPSSVQNITTSIDVSTATKGSNLLTLQFRDSLGNWSVPIATSFVRASGISPQLVSYRYWFNGDMANVTEVPITPPTNVLDGNLTLDASFLGIGTHSVSTQYKNAQGAWSVPTADNFYKNTVAIKKNKYATLSLNKSILNTGDTIRISGINFPKNYGDSVNIYNSKYETHFKIPFTASAAGSFQVYKIIAGSEDGYNFVGAYDSVNKRNVAVERYEVVKGAINTDTNRFIEIISPVIASNYDLESHNKISIKWKDKIYSSSKIIGNTAGSKKNYTIEYKYNSGTWQTVDARNQILASGLFSTYAEFTYTYNFSKSGKYQFRVKETDNTKNWDTTLVLNVNAFYTNNFTISKQWDYSGNYNAESKKSIMAICADGTSRFYFKIKKKTNSQIEIAKVKVVLSDSSKNISSTNLLGKVMATNLVLGYDTSGNNAVNISSTANTQGFDSAYWFWYIAPDDYARDADDKYTGEREVSANFEVTFKDNKVEYYSLPIKIFRPPLMLVHGLGSSADAWNSFKFSRAGYEQYFATSEAMFKAGVYRASMYPNSAFDVNARLLIGIDGLYINSLQGRLKKAREEDGIVCNRVDYICHSMGGSMIRYAMEKYKAEYFATYPLPYRNYNKGFTNKLITINTPHNGAATADLLNELAPMLTLPYKLKIFTKKIDNFYVLDNITNKLKVNDAVSNLQHYNRDTFTGGVRFSTTKRVRAHLIASKMYKDNIDIDNFNINNSEPMLKLLYLISIADNSTINNNSSFKNYLDTKLVKYQATNFSLNSDMVVQLPSQLAGGDYTNLKSYETLQNGGANTFHTKVTENIDIGTRCLNLLNTNISTNLFSDTIQANPSPLGLRARSSELKPADSVVEYYNTANKFLITGSIPDSIYIDSILRITMDVIDTTNLKSIEIIFQGETYNGLKSNGKNSYSFVTNSNHINLQNFLISFKYDSLGYDVYHYALKSIKVIPQLNPILFSVNPEFKVLNKKEKYSPDLDANFGSYISNITLNNSDLKIYIADDKVLKYVDSIGKFISGDSGSTFIVFNYKGLEDTFYVAISSNLNISSNSGCISPISDFNLSSTKLSITTSNSSQNTSTFKWSFGDNTFSTEENPTHTYAVNGDYSVCLTSYNPCDSHRVCKTVSVCDKPIVNFDIAVSTAEVSTTNTSTNATSYRWTFGDGQSDNTTSPKHTYTANGDYDICLTAYNNCDSATLCKKAKIEGISSTISSANTFGIIIYPNPASSVLNIDFTKNNFTTLKIENLLGQIILTKNLTNQKNQINISNLPKGNYLIELSNNKGEKYYQKLTIE